jgi:hypothetical protein
MRIQKKKIKKKLKKSLTLFGASIRIRAVNNKAG